MLSFVTSSAESFDDECLNLAGSLTVSTGVTMNRPGIYLS